MSFGTPTLLVLFLALILDRFLGDPDWLWSRIRHPVVLFGAAISWCDDRFNRPELSGLAREKRGFLSLAALVILAIVSGLFFGRALAFAGWLGVLVEICVVAVFLARKSLEGHVRAVADGLRQNGIGGGREAVSMIVGRNPDELDRAGVSRAAIESLAENASDGVVAPAFWYAVFGLPGLFAYKMLNTADSMIGHKNDRYLDFGRASAKFDDFANWLPARLCGVLIVLAGPVNRFGDNFRIMASDASLHRSPNAGWPEAAMAAVTDLALGGPRNYDGVVVQEGFLNASGNMNASASDIDGAISVFGRAMNMGTAFVGLLALFLS